MNISSWTFGKIKKKFNSFLTQRMKSVSKFQCDAGDSPETIKSVELCCVFFVS